MKVSWINFEGHVDFLWAKLGWLSGWWITWGREGVRIGKGIHENYEDGSMRNGDSTSINAF